MAIVRAVKSGNWSDTTVWNTGTLPTSADDVYSNTFTVTIDVSPTVLSISNAATTGVTAGGTFVVSASGFTITCTGAGIISGSVGNQAVQGTVAAGGVCNIIANIESGAGVGGVGLWITSGTGVYNITGNIRAAGPGSGINSSSACTLNITGNITGGVNQGVGLALQTGASANITGSLTGGTFTAAVNNLSTGILNHVGIVQASAGAPGIGAGNIGQITILTGPLLSNDASTAGAAASGVNPCAALRWFPADTALGTFEYRMRGQTLSGSPSIRPARQMFLTDAYSATYPATSNVRSGTTYGPGNIYTGTVAIPPAASVLTGVPVDNTIGTAAITQADIVAATTTALTAASAVTLNQQTSSLTTPGSIGERLKLASTVATTAQQLSDALSNE